MVVKMLSHHKSQQLLQLSVDDVVSEPVELSAPLELKALLDLQFEVFTSHLVWLVQH